MKMRFIAPYDIPGIFDSIVDERHRICDRCPREWRRNLFLSLRGPGYAGIQREHKPDYRHRDRGAEKVTPDFLDMGPMPENSRFPVRAYGISQENFPRHAPLRRAFHHHNGSGSYRSMHTDNRYPVPGVPQALSCRSPAYRLSGFSGVLFSALPQISHVSPRQSLLPKTGLLCGHRVGLCTFDQIPVIPGR